MKLICTKSRAQNRESLKDNESYRSLKPYQVALHFAILKKYTRSGKKCVTVTNQAKRARELATDTKATRNLKSCVRLVQHSNLCSASASLHPPPEETRTASASDPYATTLSRINGEARNFLCRKPGTKGQTRDRPRAPRQPANKTK